MTLANVTLTVNEQDTVSQENCAKLFLSKVRQISTNFDIFWQNDS